MKLPYKMTLGMHFYSEPGGNPMSEVTGTGQGIKNDNLLLLLVLLFREWFPKAKCDHPRDGGRKHQDLYLHIF